MDLIHLALFNMATKIRTVPILYFTTALGTNALLIKQLEMIQFVLNIKHLMIQLGALVCLDAAIHQKVMIILQDHFRNVTMTRKAHTLKP